MPLPQHSDSVLMTSHCGRQPPARLDQVCLSRSLSLVLSGTSMLQANDVLVRSIASVVLVVWSSRVSTSRPPMKSVTSAVGNGASTLGKRSSNCSQNANANGMNH
eukprot:1676590-Amphidinium_carterae.1